MKSIGDVVMRLHKARLMMIEDGLSASRASSRVGYESPSQFSREYSRLFGRPPKQDASQLRENISDVSSIVI